MHRLMLFVCVFGLLMTAPAHETNAAEIEGVSFPEQISVDERPLQLRGTALLKHLLVIKAYVGGLYLPARMDDDKILSDVPKCLILHYFHAIPAADFAKATTTMIEKNLSQTAFKALKSRIDQMNALYRDVNPGDEYQALYIPGEGTSLSLNDKYLGAVPGASFARAYFAIWLGENPINKSFRDGLLGR